MTIVTLLATLAIVCGDCAAIAGRVVAVGIPGAGAVSVVGAFHPGSPIHDKPAFRAYTQPGAILDPERVLVASSSNFGAPVARADEGEGAILSIDPRGSALIVIPESFASDGAQATAVGGRVMLFTANSAPFLNRVNNPDAVTAAYASVGRPTGISLNNAFGRVWVTSMPCGPIAAGIHSVLDPDGRPLADAPSRVAGGVFTGVLTNRAPQLAPGSMASGAIATALLGRSPDGGGRAVFASLHADGSIVQLHVEQGVDGLAPAGTIMPVDEMRSGMLLNWVPNPILYVADPRANAIIALSLRTDGTKFCIERTRRITSRAFDVPIDLAPAIAEVASSGFASNTTLAGDSDIYVANRGNGTIARLTQRGDVIAIRRVTLPGIGTLGANRINGVAISPDARTIWITVSGSLPGSPEGALVRLPAFGAGMRE